MQCCIVIIQQSLEGCSLSIWCESAVFVLCVRSKMLRVSVQQVAAGRQQHDRQEVAVLLPIVAHRVCLCVSAGKPAAEICIRVACAWAV